VIQRKPATRRLGLALCGAALLGCAANLAAFDLRTPPSTTVIDHIVSEGFAASKKRIEQALVAEPSPEKLKTLGAWLDLWRWTDLLSRDASEENASLAQRHFFRDKSTSQIYFLTLDQSPPPTLEELDRQTARQIASEAPARAEMTRSLLPAGASLPSGPLATIAGPALICHTLGSPSFSRAFFSTISPRDHLGLVLKNLRTMHEADPAAFAEFQNLAIALAVVNDSAVHPSWPHPQVTRDLVPIEVPPVAAQFSRWIRDARSGSLLLDIRTLPPDQLKFMVDAFVSPSEIIWARKHVRHPRSRFTKAFDEITYREDRIKAGRFHWTSGPYTLEAIRKTGGICVDQAYFAMLAGKANGLPTLFFTGQGSDGGHAWFGYLRGEDRWELDCGRYSQQNYAVGRALDPQTWQPVSDHELKLLAASVRNTPKFTRSSDLAAMAGILESAGLADRAAGSLAQAREACLENHEAWDASAAFLERNNAAPAERMAIHKEAIARFASAPDIKVRHQLALATLQRATGDAASAQKTESLVVRQNKNKRSDLSVGVASMQVQAALDRGDLDTAALEFHKKLQTIGKKGGGDFVKEVGLPFVCALLSSGNKTRAKRTIDTMRQKFTPLPSSPLDRALLEMEALCK